MNSIRRIYRKTILWTMGFLFRRISRGSPCLMFRVDIDGDTAIEPFHNQADMRHAFWAGLPYDKADTPR